MVANGCRANKNAFELHYLFANNRENWFAHATAISRLGLHDSFAGNVHYPASRLSEIKDLFGIKPPVT